MIHPKIERGVAKFLDADENGVWKIGQRLTIGEIINHKGESVDSLMLEPQGIAHLISSECVHLPQDVCGLAHVLTTMCNEGLLTLNIGVVDPGWKNHLSTPVLNFSSERRLLQKGAPFSRITYHKIDISEGATKGAVKQNFPSEDYRRDVRARAVGDFSKSFLNIRRLVGKAFQKETVLFRNSLLKYVPIGAFSLAFFAMMVTVGIAGIARLASDGQQREEIQRLSEKVEKLEAGRLENKRNAISTDEMGKRESEVISRSQTGASAKQ